MIGCLCSTSPLANSTPYNELFIGSSPLDSLLLKAACVFCHWGNSLQGVGFCPWSGNCRSCWPEASMFLQRHLSLDFQHLAFLRLSADCTKLYFGFSQKHLQFLGIFSFSWNCTSNFRERFDYDYNKFVAIVFLISNHSGLISPYSRKIYAKHIIFGCNILLFWGINKNFVCIKPFGFTNFQLKSLFFIWLLKFNPHIRFQKNPMVPFHTF